MNGQTLGLIGGIVGGVIGVIGGIIGTYFSIKNTNGPKERTLMIKASIYAWLFVAFFLLCIFLIPFPYGFFAFIPYGIILPIGIKILNKKQKEIKEEELNQTA